jgi:uncharacterized FAD-dependent dehydrogenase
MSPYKSEDAEEPEIRRSVSPDPPRAQIELRIALELLRNARDHIGRAKCPSTLKKIRSAIKSAEGARRHLKQRVATGVVT